jgi:hypothetical protein
VLNFRFGLIPGLNYDFGGQHQIRRSRSSRVSFA